MSWHPFLEGTSLWKSFSAAGSRGCPRPIPLSLGCRIHIQLSGPHPRGTQEEHKSYISNMAKRHPFFLFILFLPKLALVNYFQDHFWWDWIFVIDNILNAKYSECTFLFNCELLCTTNTQEAGKFVSNSSLCLDLYFIYTAVWLSIAPHTCNIWHAILFLSIYTLWLNFRNPIFVKIKVPRLNAKRMT